MSTKASLLIILCLPVLSTCQAEKPRRESHSNEMASGRQIDKFKISAHSKKQIQWTLSADKALEKQTEGTPFFELGGITLEIPGQPFNSVFLSPEGQWKSNELHFKKEVLWKAKKQSLSGKIEGMVWRQKQNTIKALRIKMKGPHFTIQGEQLESNTPYQKWQFKNPQATFEY